MKVIPFPIPSIVINDDIVYPKQNPRYSTSPKTIGKPITVDPKNHNNIANDAITHILSRLMLLANAESIKSNMPVAAPTIAKIKNCFTFSPSFSSLK